MGSHLSLRRSASNLHISCSLAVLLETIETAAPPVAWPSLTWVSQSRWLAGWHNTVLVPYAYYLSSLPDPTYAYACTCTCTCSHMAWPAGLTHAHRRAHTDAHIHKCVHTHTHTHTHTQARTHTYCQVAHTHTHTHTHTLSSGLI